MQPHNNPHLLNGARWKRGYNPDLIFVSETIDNSCGHLVMEPIPHMHIKHHSEDVSTYGTANQQNSISLLQMLNPSHKNTVGS